MSERYSKLFALSENLYSAGAPVVIAAGALQKDNQTGKVFAQLKIRNIQDKAIKAATVKITPFDTVGKPLGGTVDYQYLDLSAGRDTDFGQKTPVMLKEAATRSFAVSVSEVIFSDNSIWTAPDEAWEPLSAPVMPEKEFTDVELAKQYRVKYGADCKCVFKKEKDLWRCACGAVNHASEKNCHSCQREAAALAALDIDKLKADRDQRLAAEQKKAAEEKAAAEAESKKTKRIVAVVAPIMLITIAIISAISWKNIQEERKSNSAYLVTQDIFTNEDGEAKTRTYTYDDEGNQVEIDFGDGQRDTYSYDQNGNLVQCTSYGRNGKAGYIGDRTYDSQGNCIKYIDRDLDDGTKSTYTYEYDSAGNLTREEHDYEYLREFRTTTYTYDGKGNCVKEFLWTQDYGDWDICLTATLYTYEDGLLAEETVYRDYRYNSMEEPDEDWYTKWADWRRTIVYTYDAAGHCIEKKQSVDSEEWGDDPYTYRYTYQGDNCIEEVYEPADGNGYTKTMTYDDHDNCITKITEYDDGRTYKHEYTYKFIYAPHVVEKQKQEAQN